MLTSVHERWALTSFSANFCRVRTASSNFVSCFGGSGNSLSFARSSGGSHSNSL